MLIFSLLMLAATAVASYELRRRIAVDAAPYTGRHRLPKS